MTHSLMCSSVVEHLEALHDGELSIDEQVHVERHLDVCAGCHATARELREVRDVVSVGLGARAYDEAQVERDLEAMSQSVVSRVRTEREASWPAQFAHAFEDLHFVYAGLGAMSATASCIVAIAGLLYFAPAQRDDSLSGRMAAISQAGSNRYPVALEEGIQMPRVDDETVNVLGALPEVPEPGALAVAGVVTQEGTLSEAAVLPAKDGGEMERRVMQAVSSSRFHPAQRQGSPVAVNLIWLFEQTTVRGTTGKI
jgi:hypothetical protein